MKLEGLLVVGIEKGELPKFNPWSMGVSAPHEYSGFQLMMTILTS